MGAIRTKLIAGAAFVAIALHMGGVAQSQEIAPTGQYQRRRSDRQLAGVPERSSLARSGIAIPTR